MTQYLQHASAYFADALAQMVIPFWSICIKSSQTSSAVCDFHTPRNLVICSPTLDPHEGLLQETEQLFGLSYYHAKGGWVTDKYCVFIPDISHHRQQQWCTSSNRCTFGLFWAILAILSQVCALCVTQLQL